MFSDFFKLNNAFLYFLSVNFVFLILYGIKSYLKKLRVNTSLPSIIETSEDKQAKTAKDDNLKKISKLSTSSSSYSLSASSSSSLDDKKSNLSTNINGKSIDNSRSNISNKKKLSRTLSGRFSKNLSSFSTKIAKRHI